MPLAATHSPSSVHTRISVSALSVRVPAKAACSGEKPVVCVGKNNTALSASAACSGAQAAAMMPSAKSLSTLSGRCGPCCSVAATGKTAMARLRSSEAKSVVLRCAQRWGPTVG